MALNSLSIGRKLMKCLHGLPASNRVLRKFSAPSEPIDFPDMGPPIPEFKVRSDEDLETKRARLMYQSRKRGTSEVGLLLGNFSAKYLKTFDLHQLNDFDTLINQPSNDWDLYYWVVGKQDVPDLFKTGVMDLLQRHAKNEKMEARYMMAELDGSCARMQEK